MVEARVEAVSGWHVVVRDVPGLPVGTCCAVAVVLLLHRQPQRMFVLSASASPPGELHPFVSGAWCPRRPPLPALRWRAARRRCRPPVLDSPAHRRAPAPPSRLLPPTPATSLSQLGFPASRLAHSGVRNALSRAASPFPTSRHPPVDVMSTPSPSSIQILTRSFAFAADLLPPRPPRSVTHVLSPPPRFPLTPSVMWL